MIRKYLQRGESGLCILALGGNPGGAIVLFQDRCIYQLVLKIVSPISNGMVNFGDFPMLELHAQVPVRFRMTGYGKNPGCVLVKAMTHLRIGFRRPGQLQNIGRFNPIVQGRNKRRLADDQVIRVGKQD